MPQYEEGRRVRRSLGNMAPSGSLTPSTTISCLSYARAFRQIFDHDSRVLVVLYQVGGARYTTRLSVGRSVSLLLAHLSSCTPDGSQLYPCESFQRKNICISAAGSLFKAHARDSRSAHCHKSICCKRLRAFVCHTSWPSSSQETYSRVQLFRSCEPRMLQTDPCSILPRPLHRHRAVTLQEACLCVWRRDLLSCAPGTLGDKIGRICMTKETRRET